MKNIAVITGASSGFGKAIAYRFAESGFNLILTARRADLLETIKSDLTQKFGINVLVLCFDVRDEHQVESAHDSIPQEWRNWSVLVNNAGLAVGRESLENGLSDDWNRMIDTNVKGLLYITRTFVRFMKENKKGTIINIGSIAGKETYAGGNVYSATKFAVDALTKSMRIDFLPYNIRVSQIAPGAAETEFSLVRFKGDTDKASSVYDGYQPLSADDIADAAWFIVSRPQHVCINDMVIMPTAQANATTFHKTI
ncbi:MAG: SDR family NAD(P)-dependent oxidoreductase [Flavobacteriales bacterium]